MLRRVRSLKIMGLNGLFHRDYVSYAVSFVFTLLLAGSVQASIQKSPYQWVNEMTDAQGLDITASTNFNLGVGGVWESTAASATMLTSEIDRNSTVSSMTLAIRLSVPFR